MPKSNFDAIISPCGGLDERGMPHPWVTRRLEAALQFYTGKEFVLVLSRGTPYKPPPIDKSGFPIDESAVSADYLLRRVVDPKKILLERTSLDTIGN